MQVTFVQSFCLLLGHTKYPLGALPLTTWACRCLLLSGSENRLCRTKVAEMRIIAGKVIGLSSLNAKGTKSIGAILPSPLRHV